MEVTFKAEKVTQNAVRFAEVTEEGKVPDMGTIYLQKFRIKQLGVDEPEKVQTLVLEIKSVAT